MNPALLVLSIPVLIFAIVFHECAHGWMANRLGDPTAKLMGRITLNPIPHVDIFGTILIPLFLLITNSSFMFGYAKPVPVDYRNLRDPHKDMLWIGLAGPLANIILMFISAIIWKLMIVTSGQYAGYTILDKLQVSYRITQPLIGMIQYSVLINMVLAIFNLIPIPPLDGSRIVMGLLPPDLAEPYSRIEPYGFFIIIALFMTGTFTHLVGPMFTGMQRILSFFHLWPHY